MKRLHSPWWRHILWSAALGAMVAATVPAIDAQSRPRTKAKAQPLASVKSVSRTPIPRGERITIELTSEVPYSGDRVSGPDRVFFDFRGSSVSTSVINSTKGLPAGELVTGVRLGRYTANSTRLVLDLNGAPRYSAFAMYKPFRLVIDVETDPPPAAVHATPPPPVATEPRPVPPPATPPATPAAAPASLAPLSAPPATTAPVMAKAAPPIDVPPPESTYVPAPAAPPPVIVPPQAPEPVREPAPVAAPPSLRTTAQPPAALKATTATLPPAPPALLSRGQDYSLARQLGLGVARVVIDAGHGGHDPGARGLGLVEANLVLDIALRVEKLLQQHPGIDVVLTRRTDEFIPLEERTAIANRESADLFLSIHANASTRATARGVETYFLNFATNPEAEAVAARENASSGRGMGKLPDLVKAIALNSKVAESRELAGMVQRSMIREMKPQNKTIRNLGVKTAPFVVLIGAEMPSVLAEISFVTNKSEATLLKQSSYKDRIAKSLADAVVLYQASLKKNRPVVAVKAAGQ